LLDLQKTTSSLANPYLHHMMKLNLKSPNFEVYRMAKNAKAKIDLHLEVNNDSSKDGDTN
jgi:hypothetical protein